MTAGNKIDLLVKDDGSTEALVATKPVLLKRRQPTLPQRFAVVTLTCLVALLVCGAITAYMVYHGHMRDLFVPQHRSGMWCGTTYQMNGNLERGELEFNTTDQSEKFITKNTEATMDGLEGKTGIKLTAPDKREICLVRDDFKYGKAGPPLLPRKELLEKFMEQDQELDVVMDDKIWIADGRINSDFEIPPSIQFTCNGKPIFGMRPMTDADFMIPEMDDDDMMGTLNIGDDYKDDHPDYDVEKRGISEDNEYTPTEEPPSEENEPSNENEPSEENEPDAPGQGSSYVGQTQTDYDLPCCNHCRRPHLQCSQVCVPLQTPNYPYFYRNCRYQQCVVYMPCSWWHARVFGAV
ncbi:leukocyte cell-derived chemotaxin 1 [Ciona intestinalis]